MPADAAAPSKDEVHAKTGIASSASTTPYAVPIAQRAPKSTLVQTILFALVFNFCIVSAHFFQLLSWPLSLHPRTKPIYRSHIAYSKLAFSRALLVISQFFGPTQLVISIGDGKGGYLDPEPFVHRDKQTGRVVSIDLPSRSVWMSNHQVYTDWLYLWCVAYYADLADSMLIILKNSLKWIPFIGWGMQFYRFIFLARNWASDQAQLAKQLGEVASENHTPAAAEKSTSTETAKKLLLLIFPEGTLVSPNTRPVSAKFAEKMGIKDLENVLLPRSTGLFFCLRTLAKEMDDLWLVDFTIGYPGVPPAGYGQDYYTLRSIFMQGVPPPAIHIHFTLTRVTKPVAGDTSSNAAAVADVATAQMDTPPLGANDRPAESSDAERTAFESWLRERWTRKDEQMHRFYEQGDFVGGDFTKAVAAGKVDATQPGGKYVVLPAELRSLREIGDAACWGIPFIVGWNVLRLYRKLVG